MFKMAAGTNFISRQVSNKEEIFPSVEARVKVIGKRLLKKGIRGLHKTGFKQKVFGLSRGAGRFPQMA